MISKLYFLPLYMQVYNVICTMQNFWMQHSYCKFIIHKPYFDKINLFRCRLCIHQTPGVINDYFKSYGSLVLWHLFINVWYLVCSGLFVLTNSTVRRCGVYCPSLWVAWPSCNVVIMRKSLATTISFNKWNPIISLWLYFT